MLEHLRYFTIGETGCIDCVGWYWYDEEEDSWSGPFMTILEAHNDYMLLEEV